MWVGGSADSLDRACRGWSPCCCLAAAARPAPTRTPHAAKEGRKEGRRGKGRAEEDDRQEGRAEEDFGGRRWRCCRD